MGRQAGPASIEILQVQRTHPFASLYVHKGMVVPMTDEYLEYG
jgi:hypothetical protein